MKRTPRVAHHRQSRSGNSTLVAQTRSPSRAVVSLMAPRWTIASGWRVRRKEPIERVGMDDAVRRVLGEIAPFVLVAEPVDDHGLFAAPREGGMQIGPDESGAAGDHDHGARVIRSPSDPAKAGASAEHR